MSLTAEMWSNNKPIFMYHEGKSYVPIYIFYHPTEFGQTESMITNYRQLRADNPDTFMIWPPNEWDPFESNKEVEDYPSPPTSENVMGTDDRGRDVLSRLIYGFRYSIGFAFLVWIFTYFLGTFAGAIMGFFGGRTDLLGQRIVEIFESIPTLLLLIVLVSIFGGHMWVIVMLTSLFGWMLISNYVRAEFLKLRKREFVDAARALGVHRGRVMFKHILPNALGPILTFSPFSIAGNIYLLSILDYLGFGLAPPTPSWGELLQQAQRYIDFAMWLAVYPCAAMILTLTVLNLIGEGVRDAFDPRKTV